VSTSSNRKQRTMDDGPRTNRPSTRDVSIYRRAMIEGRPRAEIAAEESLSESRVHSIVRAIERWLAQAQLRQDPNFLKVTHLQRLEHQWREVMQAWRRSREAEETTRISTEEGKPRKAEVTRRAQVGDVKYLDEARKILTAIRELCGAEGPIQWKSPEDELSDVTTLTLDERNAELVGLALAVHRQAAKAADLGAADGDGIPQSPVEVAAS